MRKFILIGLIALMGLLSACGANNGTGANPVPREGVITIETVEVTVAESFPVQVIAHVRGFLGDGCTSLGAITQERTGNTIKVTIAATHSGAEVCTMIAPMVDERISLEGEFPAGEYVVEVNGVATTFQV